MPDPNIWRICVYRLIASGHRFSDAIVDSSLDPHGNPEWPKRHPHARYVRLGLFSYATGPTRGVVIPLRVGETFAPGDVARRKAKLFFFFGY